MSNFLAGGSCDRRSDEWIWIIIIIAVLLLIFCCN
jgi:hypothetical protein